MNRCLEGFCYAEIEGCVWVYIYAPNLKGGTRKYVGQIINIIKIDVIDWMPVAHVCNPSYSGG
jgi:hypothetical protein